MSRITIVGAGVVGANLLRAFSAAGHQTRLAVRDPRSEKAVATRDQTGAEVVALGDAAADTGVVVLAVPHDAVTDAMAGLGHPGDTIVVDATNPVGVTLPAEASSTLDLLAQVAPGARLVKAFNTIGAEAYVDPTLDAGPAFLPVAGDDGAAAEVAALAADLGFDAMVVGDRGAARLLETMAEFWIHLALSGGLGRDFGFVRSDRGGA